MIDLFWAVLYLSLLASLAALVAVPLRWLFRTCRLPAWLCVALWLAVLVRMALPAGVFTSSLSLLRWSAPAIEQRVDAWAQAENALYTAPISQPPAPQTGENTPPLAAPAPVQAPAPDEAIPETSNPTAAGVLAWVWAVGVLALWGYAAFSALKLHLRLRTAVRQGEGQSLRWECDCIPGPFVFGLFRPKIYVPVGLEGDTLKWVLCHERAHLRLGHHWLKPLFFVVLALHWFNPILWLAWVLFCRDLEVLCDEHVLKNAPDQRKAYSTALLSLAAPKEGLMLPPGFGETGVKDRVKRALRYRKPAARVVAIAGVLAVLCICCLGAEPVSAALPEDTPTPAAHPDGEPQTDRNSSAQLWPEVDMENLLIRYPGETEWTELAPLIPAPAIWAGQTVGGRSLIKYLDYECFMEDRSPQCGFVSGMDGWLTFSFGLGGVGPRSHTSIYRTHDGGHTWTEAGCIDGSAYGDGQEYLYFFVDSAGFFDDSHALLCTGLYNSAPVFYTEDGGVSWTLLELPGMEIKTVPDRTELEDLGSHTDPDITKNGLIVELRRLPEADISVYCLKTEYGYHSGLLLRQGKIFRYFPDVEVWVMPNRIPAQVGLADYDGDGAEELAVAVCTGTGTEMERYRLYLFERDDRFFRLSATLLEEGLDTQVNATVASSYDPESYIMTAETAGRTWTLDLSSEADWLSEAPVGQLSATYIFAFDLTVPMQMSVYLVPSGMPIYMPVQYKAQLHYDGERITLDTDSGFLEATSGYSLQETSTQAQ